MLVLRHATNGDRSALIELLARANMDYVEPVEAYMLILEEAVMAGCARLEDQGDFVMLRPLVIAEEYRRKGLGKHIVNRIMPDDRPTVVVARGESVPFYTAIGFTRSGWQAVPDEQRDECELCPERTICNPQPMIYIPDSCRK